MPSAPKWLFDTVEALMPKLAPAAVTATEYLSPSVKRIHLQVDLSQVNMAVGTYIDFRVNDTEVRRYTISGCNAEQSKVELIAHLHGGGPGSHYMDRMMPGDLIPVNKPRDHRYYDPSAKKIVVFGDETSLGLACSFLPVLQKNNHAFLFCLELDDENLKVPALLGLENYVVYPKDGSFSNEQWVNGLDFLQTGEWNGAHFVLTGNAQSARTFRKVLKEKNSGRAILHGYWLAGKKGL